MGWMTKKSPLAGLTTTTMTDDHDTVTDWCADDPTGSIAVVHERIASAFPATASLARPVLAGAVSATVVERDVDHARSRREAAEAVAGR